MIIIKIFQINEKLKLRKFNKYLFQTSEDICYIKKKRKK